MEVEAEGRLAVQLVTFLWHHHTYYVILLWLCHRSLNVP